MTLQDTIDDLAEAKDTAMRVVARSLIGAYSGNVRDRNIEDFVQVLGEELSKHSTDFACRTGDYDRAATLHIVAAHLMRLDDVIVNYDGASE